jgi:predicted nucleic acid-binding protein
MRYWDSSAILPLLALEADTERRRKQLQADPQIVTWWGSRLECASALSRLVRQTVLSDDSYERLLGELELLSAGWIEVQATEKLRQRALRLLRLHPLNAADALQLAAALVACAESPQTLPFLSIDIRLNEAARKEGFPVQP